MSTSFYYSIFNWLGKNSLLCSLHFFAISQINCLCQTFPTSSDICVQCQRLFFVDLISLMSDTYILVLYLRAHPKPCVVDQTNFFLSQSVIRLVHSINPGFTNTCKYQTRMEVFDIRLVRSVRIGFSITRKYQTRVEMSNSDKHSISQRKRVNYQIKSFITFFPHPHSQAKLSFFSQKNFEKNFCLKCLIPSRFHLIFQLYHLPLVFKSFCFGGLF